MKKRFTEQQIIGFLKEAEAAVLAARLVKLAHERRRFGYRRLHALVEREGTHANHKRIYRLYRKAAKRQSGKAAKRQSGKAAKRQSGKAAKRQSGKAAKRQSGKAAIPCAVRVCGETSGNRGRSCRFPGVGLKGLC